MINFFNIALICYRPIRRLKAARYKPLQSGGHTRLAAVATQASLPPHTILDST